MNLVSVLFLLRVAEAMWLNNYLTWTLVSNDSVSLAKDAIALWNVKPLALAYVKSEEEADIKIYRVSLPNSTMGRAAFPPRGKIEINDRLDSEQFYYTLQHEMGHSVGLDHVNDTESVMFEFYQSINVTDEDRKRLSDMYECQFDSVALLNCYSYLVFSGSRYKRLDLDSNHTTEDRLWFPFTRHVDSMYRSSNGNYVVLSDDRYYEFDDRLEYRSSGKVASLFPSLEYADAVLSIRGGKTYVFVNKYVYVSGKRHHYREYFNPSPEPPVKGAYQRIFGNACDEVVLVDRNSAWIYDRNFVYLYRLPLCKLYPQVHCCK